ETDKANTDEDRSDANEDNDTGEDYEHNSINEGSDLESLPSASFPPDDSKPDEFSCNPWNAICVIGLRVCSTDTHAAIQVVRPSKDAEMSKTPLDLDNAARDMVEEVEERMRQEES